MIYRNSVCNGLIPLQVFARSKAGLQHDLCLQTRVLLFVILVVLENTYITQHVIITFIDETENSKLAKKA